LREDPKLRAGFAFKVLTRECGVLAVTFSESVIELAVIFNPSEALGTRISQTAQTGQDERSVRESMLMRRKSQSSAFNPQSYQYVPFPERLRAVTTVSQEPDAAGAAAEIESHVAAEAPEASNRREAELSEVYRIGSDEAFAAYLKGVDGSAGGMHSRYVRLIEAAGRAGSIGQRELMKDLIKRFFVLVEEARIRKLQRTG
jgi:hypothetical protein